MATTRLAMTASAAALCVAVPLADAAAQEAHQCIVRRTDTTPADLPGDKTVSAYLAVPATAIVAVSASGWSEGSRSDATFGVEILKDNIVIARSSQQIGDGVLHAGVSAQITLEPGAQAKISAKPFGRDKIFHFVSMTVAVNGACS